MITCTVCRKQLTDPRSLPCLHTFCLACVAPLVAADNQQPTVDCPVCNKTCSVPPGGATQLPVNDYVMRLMNRSSSSASASSRMMRTAENETVEIIHCKVRKRGMLIL